MNTNHRSRLYSWSQLRFSIIGGLLASPPEAGELGKQIKHLASREYQHPYKDALITFGASTIERWYYKALNGSDPVGDLERKPRSDLGKKPPCPNRCCSNWANSIAASLTGAINSIPTIFRPLLRRDRNSAHLLPMPVFADG